MILLADNPTNHTALLADPIMSEPTIDPDTCPVTTIATASGDVHLLDLRDIEAPCTPTSIRLFSTRAYHKDSFSPADVVDVDWFVDEVTGNNLHDKSFDEWAAAITWDQHVAYQHLEPAELTSFDGSDASSDLWAMTNEDYYPSVWNDANGSYLNSVIPNYGYSGMLTEDGKRLSQNFDLSLFGSTSKLWRPTRLTQFLTFGTNSKHSFQRTCTECGATAVAEQGGKTLCAQHADHSLPPTRCMRVRGAMRVTGRAGKRLTLAVLERENSGLAYSFVALLPNSLRTSHHGDLKRFTTDLPTLIATAAALPDGSISPTNMLAQVITASPELIADLHAKPADLTMPEQTSPVTVHRIEL